MKLAILHVFLISWVSAGDWVIPWVANKDGSWQSYIAINNHSDLVATVDLVAVRADGEQETVTGVEIASRGHFYREAKTLFPALGSGSGYSLFIHSESEHISAAVKIASLHTASGDSPALGQAMPVEHGAPEWVFTVMPYSEAGAAAPVVVNLSNRPAQVVFKAYGETGLVIGESAPHTVAPGAPFADTLDRLFPGIEESSYVTVTSDAVLAGMTFNFNAFREPSAMLASPLVQLEDIDLYPLLITLDSAASLSSSYAQAVEDGLGFDKAAEAECPTYDVEVDLAHADSFLSAEFDWGSGCTNAFGVYHAGSIELNLRREGTLQSAGWMNGNFDFDRFATKYLGAQAEISGASHVEGSTFSSNFSLAGEWDVNADIPFYQIYASFQSNTALSINKKGTQYEAFGHFSVALTNSFNARLDAVVDDADPLLFEFSSCPWPLAGSLEVTYYEAGFRISGSIQFASGNCNTALVNLNGQSWTIYLPGVYVL